MNVKEVSMRKMRKSRMESAAIGVLPRGVCKVGASLHGIHNDVPMNPCPCGWNGDSRHACNCTPSEIKRYTRRISGPLLDRIDLHIRMPRVEYKDLSSEKKGERSAVIRERVTAARERQTARLKGYPIYCNAQMSHAMLETMCPLNQGAKALLEAVFKKMDLSARSYDRIIKVARTIADLDGSEGLQERHVAEAIQLRNDIGLESN